MSDLKQSIAIMITRIDKHFRICDEQKINTRHLINTIETIVEYLDLEGVPSSADDDVFTDEMLRQYTSNIEHNRKRENSTNSGFIRAMIEAYIPDIENNVAYTIQNMICAHIADSVKELVSKKFNINTYNDGIINTNIYGSLVDDYVGICNSILDEYEAVDKETLFVNSGRKYVHGVFTVYNVSDIGGHDALKFLMDKEVVRTVYDICAGSSVYNTVTDMVVPSIYDKVWVLKDFFEALIEKSARIKRIMQVNNGESVTDIEVLKQIKDTIGIDANTELWKSSEVKEMVRAWGNKEDDIDLSIPVEEVAVAIGAQVVYLDVVAYMCKGESFIRAITLSHLNKVVYYTSCKLKNKHNRTMQNAENIEYWQEQLRERLDTSNCKEHTGSFTVVNKLFNIGSVIEYMQTYIQSRINNFEITEQQINKWENLFSTRYEKWKREHMRGGKKANRKGGSEHGE